jgi:hypothetical protein
MRKILPCAVFAVVLGVWTWKLLEPSPVPEQVLRGIPTDWKFWLSKALHVGAYAFLTLLARWLPLRRMYFWWVVGFLAVHAIGTEIGQTYVPNRHGSAMDVAIDWAGIGTGLLVLRWWAIRRLPSSAPPTQQT